MYKKSIKNLIRTPQNNISAHVSKQRGFTLIELVVVIVILGILASTALPRFINLNRYARVASIQSLAGSVRSSMHLVEGQVMIKGMGSAGQQPNITWIQLADGTDVRVWSGYPDRWCDGIGVLQQGFIVPTAGCYLSNAPIENNGLTFYGFGNSAIPGGDAGWRIESASTPSACAVQYVYNGSGTPAITAHTSGC
jgi:MSHA pilin protein MshA